MNGQIRIVIVGNGIAGVMAAAHLRRLEPYEYYARIRLPEVFASRLSAEELAVYKPSWYENNRVHVFKNQEVVSIDRGARKILTASGASVGYDRLLLCTGADSYLPPIANAALDGVFTIREYGDADAVRRSLAEGTTRAAVIGGGLLGLEAARGLAMPSVEMVTIVEVAPRLLPRQLDERGAGLLASLIEGPRCRVVLGAKVASFIGGTRVRGVRLEDGTEIPAQTVLVSAGIAPRVGLARSAGLAVNHGVVVDERLRTTDPDIFAAGDLVEFQGVVWGIIPAALEHAPVVAANMLGRPALAYRQTIPQNTLKVAGIALTSIGAATLEGAEARDCEIIDKLDRDAGRYEKYVLRGGTLIGCILLGSRANLPFATQHIGGRLDAAEVRSRLW